MCTATIVDANLMDDSVMGRRVTALLPIEWFCKKQSTAESATYGSEFVAACIATVQIMDLHLSLWVALEGPSWMLGDTLSVINSFTIPI